MQRQWQHKATRKVLADRKRRKTGYKGLGSGLYRNTSGNSRHGGIFKMGNNGEHIYTTGRIIGGKRGARGLTNPKASIRRPKRKRLKPNVYGRSPGHDNR